MELSSLSLSIMELVESRHKTSKGHCGIKPVDIKLALDVDYSVIREGLNQLYENKLITVRDGINGLLIFKPW